MSVGFWMRFSFFWNQTWKFWFHFSSCCERVSVASQPLTALRTHQKLSSLLSPIFIQSLTFFFSPLSFELLSVLVGCCINNYWKWTFRLKWGSWIKVKVLLPDRFPNLFEKSLLISNFLRLFSLTEFIHLHPWRPGSISTSYSYLWILTLLIHSFFLSVSSISVSILPVCSVLKWVSPSLSLSLSLFVFCSFCCLCTNMSAVCLPGSQQVWGLYLITTRLNSLRQWRLIWRGGPGLSLPDSMPNTITPLFRYPAVCYNFAIFQCQCRAFWRVFIEFPAGPCCRGHFLSAFTVTRLWNPPLCFIHCVSFIRASFHHTSSTVFHC